MTSVAEMNTASVILSICNYSRPSNAVVKVLSVGIKKCPRIAKPNRGDRQPGQYVACNRPPDF